MLLSCLLQLSIIAEHLVYLFIFVSLCFFLYVYELCFPLGLAVTLFSLKVSAIHMLLGPQLTCCASLAAAAASPVSTDATRAPSLAGRSCFGRVGITLAINAGNLKHQAFKIKMSNFIHFTAMFMPGTFWAPRCVIPVFLALHLSLVGMVFFVRLQGRVNLKDQLT